MYFCLTQPLLNHKLVAGEHVLRVESFVELLLRHDTLLEHDVIDGAVGLESFLCHLRRGLVADVGVQSGDNTNRILHHLVAALLVDSDAKYTLLGEGFDGVLHPSETLDEGFCDDGFHHVELQLTSLCGEGNGCVVTDDLETNLVDNLRNDGIHLAGHD